jgi:capsular polysaccharide biosynthesis protein
MFDLSLDSIYSSKGLKFYSPISDAEIWHQRFIFTENKVLNLDATASPSLGFVAGIWPFIWKIGQKDSRYAILAPGDSPINLDAAIFLMGRVDENWYHFLLDTAPRLLFFEDVPSFVPILIRNDIPETSKEFLRSLTSREVIEIAASDFVKVKMLYVLPGRSSIFDSQSPKGMNEIDFSPIVLKMFRNKVFESLSIESNGTPVKRISFNRKSVTRNVVNWGKICQVLNHFSFDDVPFDSKFFRDQVQIFSDSNIVVSPGGAVLANTIFMNPGSVVIALTSFRSQKIDLWRKLSDALDLQYADVKGIPFYWGFSYQRKLHSNFYVSPRKLRRILSREI